MNSTRRRALAAVTGALVLLTAACGGATGAEDLLQEQGGPASSTARAPESSSSSSSSSPSSSATPSPSSATPPASSNAPPGPAATCSTANLPATRGATCARSVTVDAFEIVRPTCYVDTEIGHGAEGTLYAPCEGDGEATLVFGSMTFRGGVVSGQIDVCAGTEFPWQDGCVWTSAQRVSGDLSKGVLAFGYGEAPKAGESGCATACSASGALRVR